MIFRENEKPILLAKDDEALECAKLIKEYCERHPLCEGCVFNFTYASLGGHYCKLKNDVAQHWRI